MALTDLPDDVLECLLLTHCDPRDAVRVCVTSHALLRRLSHLRLRAASRRLRWSITETAEVTSLPRPTRVEGRARHAVAQVLSTGGRHEWTVRIVASEEDNGWLYMGVCTAGLERSAFAWTLRLNDGLLYTMRISKGRVGFDRRMPWNLPGGMRQVVRAVDHGCIGRNVHFRMDRGVWSCRVDEGAWVWLVTFPTHARLSPFVYLPRPGDRVCIVGCA
jgi:hypothetical protein